MKKTVLSNEQLNEIIELRKNGTNWLQIQNKTGIPRAIAQREYETWEETKSQDALKEARTDVAKEVFRDHINYLIRIAETLTDKMRTPIVGDKDNADDFLDKAWEMSLILEGRSHRPTLSESVELRMAAPGRAATFEHTASETLELTDIRRNLRQNHMLLKSLIDHTRDRVHWKNLDNWKNNWNTSLSDINKLRQDGLKMIETFLDREESKYPSVKKYIYKNTPHGHPFEHIADDIIKELLRRLENNESDLYKNVTIIRQQQNTILLTYFSSNAMILKFNDMKSAEIINRVCNDVAKALVKKYEKDLIISLKNSLSEIKKIQAEFEVALDPLVLRPVIIKTSCNLCPA